MQEESLIKKKKMLSGAKNSTIQINPINEYKIFPYHFVIGHICFVVKKSHDSKCSQILIFEAQS